MIKKVDGKKERQTAKTLESLNSMFFPKSIAVIGASRDEKSVGYGILKNLARGGFFTTEFNMPFGEKIFAVNPNADFILGYKCFAKVTDIPEEVDLAVICVPAKFVLNVINDCARKEVKGAVIISAGFAELGEEGKKLQEKVTETAEKHSLRIIGPNCLGIIRPSAKMNATFAPAMPPAGSIAFLTQSGALADSVIDWAVSSKYGFSSIISYGNQADLDICDFLEWLLLDDKTKAIAIYLEGIKDGRRFMEVAKRVTKTKPIIALKAGRTEKGIKAISSHTGSLAGEYEIFQAAFKQSGVMIADSVEELFDLAKTLASQPPCAGKSIAVITNGGGCGVLTADYCEALGIEVPELKPATISRLDKTGKMHPAYSRGNPLDLVGDALPERYSTALNILLAENYISGAIVVQTLQTMTSTEEDAKIIIEASHKYPDKPIVCVFMGGKFTKPGQELLKEYNIPNFNDPKKAALAMSVLIKRGEYLRK